MGIFDKIKDAIWGDDSEAAPEARASDRLPGNVTLTTPIAPEVAALDTLPSEPTRSDTALNDSQVRSTSTETHPAQSPASTMSGIDVAAQLDRAASVKGQDLNWRTSIVDLMKVVGMDASLQERRDLARELNYSGDTDDTASMNMFLHRALMKKLAENGGKVPAEYLD